MTLKKGHNSTKGDNPDLKNKDHLFFDDEPISQVPNSVTKIFGFSLIRHEFSLTTVTKLLRQRHGI